MPNQTRPSLTVEPREASARKSDLRSMRRAGQIPGVIYGHGEQQQIRVAATSLRDYLGHHAAGAILDIDLEGRRGPALMKEVERHPVTGAVLHLGFQRVDLRETVKTSIPILFTGEESVIANDLVPERQITELEVIGRAELLPESITVDLSGISEPTAIRIADLEIPEGLEPTKDRDLAVMSIGLPTVAAEVEAALEAEEAARLELVAAGAAEAAEATGEEAEEVEESAEETPAETS